MRACAGYLHQVQGTLRMLELQAPAMVAGEMEQLAGALIEGVPGNRDDALAALMRGVARCSSLPIDGRKSRAGSSA